jgi:hypothetical protein
VSECVLSLPMAVARGHSRGPAKKRVFVPDLYIRCNSSHDPPQRDLYATSTMDLYATSDPCARPPLLCLPRTRAS